MGNGYYCKECGAEVEYKPVEGVFVRKCDHTGTIIAGMKAVARGVGSVNQNAR